jgi:hypothetical protein
MKTNKNILIILPVIGGCLLSACFAQGKPLPTEIVTRVPIFSSPTSSINPSQTPLPTAILTNTPVATWTPLPTLELNQARQKINGLNLNNGGCQLPCWWGIVPSKTTWPEAIHFLAPFSEIKQGESGSFLEDGKKHFATNFSIYYDIASKTESWRLLLSVQDEVVTDIEVLPPDTEHNFKLNQLLVAFGMPNQIYVSAQPDAQTNKLLPARIILDYSDVGIWASYEFPLTKVGQTLKICPQPIGARLDLWNPKVKNSRRISIEEFVNRITGFEPRKLEDISKMTIESFYETFQNPNTTICLETQVNLWP